jgi:hypothetical protein
MNSTPLSYRVKYSPISRLATFPMRAQQALTPWLLHSARVLRYVIGSREWSDARYDHESIGIASMAAALSLITRVDASVIRGYAHELCSDSVYGERFRDRLAHTRLRYISDPELHLGKGLFYYMLVRASKAKLVFEAGTDKGFGAFAICRALIRNASEGTDGHLVTVDIKIDRGDMLDGDEAGLVTRLTGDSLEAIAAFDRRVELFIHDTTSEAGHMQSQLESLPPHLAPGAIIYTTWFTQTFVDFCERSGLSYLEVADKPLNHWYRGSRYGLAWAWS